MKNQYQSLQELDNGEIENKLNVDHSQVEYLGVGAGIGGGFENTEELKPMKYKEVICGPDGKAWKVEILNEYKPMVDKNFLKR